MKFVDLFVAQVNLVFQIVVLAVFSVSLMLKSKRKLYLHGITMLIALVFNTASFAVVMLPSSLRLNYSFNLFSLVTITHVILGALAESFAVWLVASWHLQSSFQSCMKRKKIMRVTMVLWLMALLLGILVYIFLYTNLIP